MEKKRPNTEDLHFPECLQAAEQGDAEAQFSLGRMYYTGCGTAADKAKAFYWYAKAACQGHAAAQYARGFMQFRGLGIRADKLQGLYWICKAYKNGFREA